MSLRQSIESLDENTLVDGSRCLEFGIPWIVPEAVYKLEESVNDTDNVLEIGTGGSTVFFAQRCQEVIGIETNEAWAERVEKRLSDQNLFNVDLSLEKSEDDICKAMIEPFTNHVSVLSIDPQGDFNRSRILSLFLAKERPELRMIILDNYSHPELFQYHHDRCNFMGDDWGMFTYDHPRWAGSGTRIFIKKTF